MTLPREQESAPVPGQRQSCFRKSKISTYLTGKLDLTDVHLPDVYLVDVHLTYGGVHLTDVYLIGMYLTGVHVMGIHFIGMHLIYESSLRAGHGWRESLYRHSGWFKSF
jgi:hypothetical protein